MTQSNNKSRSRKVSTHKTFQRNQRAIHRALNHRIAMRSRGVDVRDICRDAGLSSPTFYAHCANVDSAYQDYELGLVNEFLGTIPERAVRGSIFTLLLSFVYRYRSYFRATAQSSDLHTLLEMIDRTRFILVGRKISDRSFAVYRSEIAGMVMVWANFDNFDKAKLDLYHKKISRIRICEW